LGAEQPLKHSQLVARRNAMGIVTAITPEQEEAGARHRILVAMWLTRRKQARNTYRAPFMRRPAATSLKANSSRSASRDA